MAHTNFVFVRILPGSLLSLIKMNLLITDTFGTSHCVLLWGDFYRVYFRLSFVQSFPLSECPLSEVSLC